MRALKTSHWTRVSRFITDAGPRLRRVVTISGAALLLVSALVSTASAIPSFARKYGTSCTTCHTIFPKLNPFGEAFRRNNFRFPGVDSDMTKEEAVPMGNEGFKKLFPKSVWPSTIAGSVPFSLATVGQITLHPDTGSPGAKEDDGAPIVLDNMVDEVMLFAAGSFDDSITYFSELSITGDGIEIEHGSVMFSDLIGPKHAVNLTVGRTMPTLTSFGMHSTYLGDGAIPMMQATAAFGGTDPESSWAATGNVNLLEVRGTIAGRLGYSVGISQGVNGMVRAPDNVYGHVGYKIGGVRLDGEDSSTVPDAMKPWAETSLTLDAFGHYSTSRYGGNNVKDTATVYGGAARLQVGSLQLNSGVTLQSHDNVNGAGMGGKTFQQFDELSYVVFPWLVPAVRVEYTALTPDKGDATNEMAIMPGVAALVRPNLKLTVIGNIQRITGTDAATNLQSVAIGMEYAY